ncbi:ankyrin repeat domain-containing protein [Allobranchiibius sp. CTAmp26]|nr:ankyrin repeat domain-containing protein [Allobranchiibius sp. CTAmp26]
MGRASPPLHSAAKHGAVDAARTLTDGGAEVDRVDTFGNTPLFDAEFNSKGRGDLILLLRGLGADPLAVNASGRTPVGLARRIGNYDVAKFFGDLPA